MVAVKQGIVIGGKYRLERALAQGGMGSVWVAQHLQLDSEVAIKFMDPAYVDSDDARARFEREAKSSALLKSPNVVQVYDYGLQDDMPYIVMELLEGEDLEAKLRREGRLSLSTTARILSDACKALRRAHEVNLIHRDLKPANLFLTRHGDEQITKVLDFGIAKSIGPQLAGKATKTGVLVGSPYYMSPEQIRTGKQIDHRTDIWSLGVIAFECITGKLPFPGSEVGDVLVAICSDPIPPPSQVVPGLSPEIDKFFVRALTRDPEQRFQSVRELSEALSALALSVEGATTERAGPLLTPPESGPKAISPEDIPFAKTAVQENSRPPLPILSRVHDPSTSAVTAPGRPIPGLSPAGTLSPAGSSLVIQSGRGGGRKGVVVVAAIGLVVAAGVGGIMLMPVQQQKGAATPDQTGVLSAAPAPVTAPTSPVELTAAPGTPTAPSNVVPTAASSVPGYGNGNGKKPWPPTKATASASASASAPPAAPTASASASATPSAGPSTTPSASASAAPLIGKAPRLRTATGGSSAQASPSAAPSAAPHGR